ncbi:MAG TPA: hypothetical protein VK447_11450 [Myxococcaceae bacterium]|nr:hypothetical protein [Myxococcaceae bacterium]
MRRRLLFVLLPLALGLFACSRCGKSAAGTPDLARALPRNAEAVLLVPQLGNLGEKMAVLQRLKLASFLAQLQGFATAEEYLNAVVAQAGVDFRSKEDLRKAGIDPDLGLGVALLPGNEAYSVVGVRDAKALEATVARLARDRLGAGTASSSEKDGVRVIGFAPAEGAAPQLGLAISGKLAFLAAGPSARRLGTFAALAPRASLAEDSALNAALKRLPVDRDLLVYLPGEVVREQHDPLRGATFTGKLTNDGLVVRADVPGVSVQQALDALAQKPSANLFGVLPRDAFALLRFSGEPSLLAPVLPYLLGERVSRTLAEAGFDAKADALDNLKPGAVAALSLSPQVRLAGGMPALDVRRTNPFRFVHLVAAARVKDAAKAAALLRKLPPLAPKLGAKLEPAERGGHPVLLASYAQGEGTHLALAGDTLLLAAPEPRLVEALGRVTAAAEGSSPLSDPTLLKSLDERAVALVVDLRRLAESVKALPADAWGVGGFAMKATTVRWLEATDDLRAVTAGLSVKENTVQGELTLRLSPP